MFNLGRVLTSDIPIRKDGDSDMYVLRVQRLQFISGGNWLEMILLNYQNIGKD